ncbi:hypothetical protein A0H81_03475 [Grifola frondosa]|uniref:DUF6534 domain-containing protein n=1 Tax=Grifola frondosa TaxID=5627 RepID=A0A1C7MHD0_GRIFR|nr:hypothetical protein A0H81_03475 [Grifola frondosa]
MARILDGLHLALINHALYEYTVKDFSDVLAISVPTWSIVVGALSLINIASFMRIYVIGSYCSRRHKRPLRQKYFLPQSLETEQIQLDFGYHYWGPDSARVRFNITSYSGLSAGLSGILYLNFAATLTADLIVALSLCWLLAKHRTGFQRTNSIIRVLMLYGINTCALTTIFALCCLITFVKMPDDLVFLAFYFAMPKLFLNSLLATLNTRKYIREIGPNALLSIPLSAMPGTRPVVSAEGAGKPQYEDQVLQIQIQTATDMKSDLVTHINV